MQITWLGHAAFRITCGKVSILIDPFITGNPQAKNLDLQEITQGITHIALTHGHADHIGDTIAISKEKQVPVIANADLGAWLETQGVTQTRIGNTGGCVHFDGFCLVFTNALHSSAFLTKEGASLALGNANGLVFHFPNAPTVYHMGDTDIFSDMQLIEELHKPKIGLVPIGDCFTMGGAVAALACQRYFSFDTVIPCHYGTFPLLDSTAEKFETAMEGAKTRVIVPKIGEMVSFLS